MSVSDSPSGRDSHAAAAPSGAVFVLEALGPAARVSLMARHAPKIGSQLVPDGRVGFADWRVVLKPVN